MAFARTSREGVANGSAEHFALGNVSQRPGLYLTRRVDKDGLLLGVVVVKVEFNGVEDNWRRFPEPTFVTDENGVVLLSAVPDWQFMTLGTLPEADRARLRDSLQFGDAPLQPLPIRTDPERRGAEHVLATVPGTGRQDRYLQVSVPVPSTQWTFHFLGPTREPVARAATLAQAVGVLVVLLSVFAAGLVLHRRHLARNAIAAQTAVREELERRVAARTAELRDANEHLVSEMDDRRRAEAGLQQLQEELEQANKLAFLGQITAGVAHEINQPVAAIRSFADNAATFLDRAQTEPVRRNLASIAGLTQRIGAITDELRAFSRKGRSGIAPTRVAAAIDGALLLVGNALHRQGVTLIRPATTEEVWVMGERMRLEQVLVNLLQNAVDALEGTPDARIVLSVSVDADAVVKGANRVRIDVTDNGPGIAPRRHGRLVHPLHHHQTPRPGPGSGHFAGHRGRFRRRTAGAQRARRRHPFHPAAAASKAIMMSPATSLMPDSPAPQRVVFVDDDPALREANSQTLELAGMDVTALPNARAALDLLTADFSGVVVTDVRMPGIDGLQLFRALHERDPDLPVILVTGHGDIGMAVEAMRQGAYDFIPKPYPADRLLATVRNALDKRRLVLENRQLKQLAHDAGASLPLIGDTPVMQRLRRTVRHLADADVDVLIEGETGTGKEVVATALHQWSSRRREHAFVAVNCGALPEAVIESELFGHEPGAFTGAQRKRVGRIEHANKGTLFLDEIESMPVMLQVKLLRVLEAREVSPLGTNDVRPVDLRVVAATKVDLSDPAQRGDFREDLFQPAQCGHAAAAPAARAARRRRTAVFLLPVARGGPLQDAGARRVRRGPRLPEHAPLARQRARTGALCRTRGARSGRRGDGRHTDPPR